MAKITPDDVQKLRKSVSLNTSAEINEITAVLAESFGITYFAYVRSYPDGTHFFLSNHSEWTETFYKEYYSLGTFHRDFNSYQSGYALWAGVDGADQATFTACRENYNIAHGITLVEKHETYCEFFGFGTTRDNYKIINFYINNLDVLKKFAIYFRLQAQTLIVTAEKDRLILPKTAELNESPVNLLQLHTAERAIFLRKIDAIINPQKNPLEKLSNREVDCIMLTLQGKTAKEVGRALEISPRTVETYLTQAKDKLNCKNKFELFAKLTDAPT